MYISVKGVKFSQEDLKALSHRIQFGGDEVVQAKDGAGSATLSMVRCSIIYFSLSPSLLPSSPKSFLLSFPPALLFFFPASIHFNILTYVSLLLFSPPFVNFASKNKSQTYHLLLNVAFFPFFYSSLHPFIFFPHSILLHIIVHLSRCIRLMQVLILQVVF